MHFARSPDMLAAPFPSAAGPGVLPFFEGCGPFKRWIPPSDKVSTAGTKTGEASGSMAPEVEDLIRSTVTKIQSEGGRIVGLIGFSQGTRVVAGLLKGTEIRRALGEQDRKDLDWLDFDFALSVCGSYPPPLLPSSMLAALESSSIPPAKQTALVQSKIAIPTLHVQGAQDEWAWAGKLLIEGTYASDEGTSEVSEFTMGHHYPVQAEDTERIKSWVVETYQRTSEGREKR